MNNILKNSLSCYICHFIKYDVENKICFSCNNILKPFIPIDKTRKIFIKKDNVIKADFIKDIIDNPELAKSYIERGEKLNPFYFPEGKKMVDDIGYDLTYAYHIKNIFNSYKINKILSFKLDKVFYQPNSCMSGLFQVEINNHLGLLASIDGITRDMSTIAIIKEKEEEYKKETLLSSMAVWNASKGIYYFKSTDKIFEINFDNEYWKDTFKKIEIWGEKI